MYARGDADSIPIVSLRRNRSQLFRGRRNKAQVIPMEAILKPELAKTGRVVGGVYPGELETRGQAREQSSSRVQEIVPMKREISSETLELESLLYPVLVGDGRPLKEPAGT